MSTILFVAFVAWVAIKIDRLFRSKRKKKGDKTEMGLIPMGKLLGVSVLTAWTLFCISWLLYGWEQDKENEQE